MICLFLNDDGGRRTPVPEGLLTIARRFNAGNRSMATRVPKGTAEISRPFRTRPTAVPNPAVNCRAIFNGSFGTKRLLRRRSKIKTRTLEFSKPGT